MIARGTLARYVPGKVFVETGTREGDVLAWAVELGITQAYSVEIQKSLFDKAVKRFSGTQNVELYLGHSPEVLEKVILPLVKTQAVFWLDAHNGESPILEELSVIAKHPIKNHILMIDDLRQMKGGRWGIWLHQVVEQIFGVNSDYTLSREDGYVPHDIFVAQVS